MANPTRFLTDNVSSQGAILTHVITDSTTGVQYLLAISPGLGSGLTMLADQDGSPLVNESAVSR